MKISDVIADMILDMFDDNKSTVQIQRNDLAARVKAWTAAVLASRQLADEWAAWLERPDPNQVLPL